MIWKCPDCGRVTEIEGTEAMTTELEQEIREACDNYRQYGSEYCATWADYCMALIEEIAKVRHQRDLAMGLLSDSTASDGNWFARYHALIKEVNKA